MKRARARGPRQAGVVRTDYAALEHKVHDPVLQRVDPRHERSCEPRALLCALGRVGPALERMPRRRKAHVGARVDLRCKVRGEAKPRGARLVVRWCRADKIAPSDPKSLTFPARRATRRSRKYSRLVYYVSMHIQQTAPGASASHTPRGTLPKSVVRCALWPSAYPLHRWTPQASGCSSREPAAEPTCRCILPTHCLFFLFSSRSSVLTSQSLENSRPRRQRRCTSGRTCSSCSARERSSAV